MEKIKKELSVAIQKGDLQKLLELLKISDYDDACQVNLDGNNFQILNSICVNGVNLLTSAVKNGKAEIVKFFINCGLNVHQKLKDGRNLVDVCKENNFQCLEILLKADAPFPYNFDLQMISYDCKNTFEQIINERNQFHSAIKGKNLQEIQTLVSKKKFLKYVYDVNNKSALTTAIQEKKFRVYSYLRSVGFSEGIDEHFQDAINNLSIKEIDLINKQNANYYKTADDAHILQLVKRSRLLGYGSENNEEKFLVIRQTYQQLSEIPLLKSILMCVSSAKKLDIVFDFDENSIINLDPKRRKGIEGNVNTKSGQILIGGKQKENNLLGNLIHELTHYALELIYNNQCKPFYPNDQNQKAFEEIVDICHDKIKQNPDANKETIVEEVFLYYNPDKFCAELIVRVPHMMAYYSKDLKKLENLKQEFKELFKFYNKTVQPVIEDSCRIIVNKQEIEELNAYLGLIDKIKASKIMFSPQSLVSLSEANDPKIIILSNICELSLEKFYHSLVHCKTRNIQSTFIFATLENVRNQKYFETILTQLKSALRPTLVVVQLSDDKGSLDENDKVTKLPPQVRTVLILPMKSIFGRKFTTALCDTIEWNDLQYSSHHKILQTKIIFQEVEVNMSELIQNNSDCSNIIKLEELYCSNDQVKIGDSIYVSYFSKSVNFYIDRTFVQLDQTTITIEELILETRFKRIVVIADKAGNGKSVALSHIAETLKGKHKSYWVSFIDLKQHTDCFESDTEETRKIEVDVSSFLSEKLSKMSERNKKVFQYLYANGECIILLDGFDEICPVYKKFVHALVTSIKENSTNQVWISTRLHLINEFDVFGSDVYVIKLNPFTKPQQIEFFEKFWKERQKSGASNKGAAEELIRKFNLQMKAHKDDFVGVPLQARILAEVFENNMSDINTMELSLLTLYREFTMKLIRIWAKRGPIAENEHSKVVMDGTRITTIHMEIARSQLFSKKSKPSSDHNPEFLTRIGIIQANGKKLDFIHSTFGEFFAAEYINDNLLLTNSNKGGKSTLDLFGDCLFVPKHEIMRKFLDVEKIAKNMNEKSRNEIIKIIKNRNCLSLLMVNLIKEDNMSLINFILRDLKLEIIPQSQIIYAAASSDNPEVIQKLFSNVLNTVPKSEQRELLMPCNGSKNIGSILNHVSANCNGESIKMILKVAEELFKNDLFSFFKASDDNNMTAIHEAARRKSIETLKILYNFCVEKFTSEERKIIFTQRASDQKNILSYAAKNGSKGVFDWILTTAREILDQKELRKFLFLPYRKKSTILHLAIDGGSNDIIKEVFSCINKEMSVNEQVKFLLTGENILFIAIRNGKGGPLKTVLNLSEEILRNEREKFSNLLSWKDKQGNSLLHAAVCKSHNIVIILLEYLRKFPNRFSQNFLQRNKNNQNILLKALSLRNRNRNKVVKEILKETVLMENIDLEAFLTIKDIRGNTIVMEAIKSKLNKTIVYKIFKALSLLTPDARNQLLDHTNNGGQHILDFAEFHYQVMMICSNFITKL